MTIIALGLWVIIIPYLGVPGSWRTTLLVLTGLGIVATGFLIRSEGLSRGRSASHHNPFVENTVPRENSLHHEQKEGINSLN